MLFAIGFLLNFLIGGVTGVMVASAPLDYQFADSYFLISHFHYTMMGGSVFGIFASIYFWFPKMTGRMLREKVGHMVFALLFAGFNLTFWPQFILGMRGMQRRIVDYPSGIGFDTPNLVSSLGVRRDVARRPAVPLRLVVVAAPRHARRRRPLGRVLSRVDHVEPAAGAQLPAAAADPLGTTGLRREASGARAVTTWGRYLLAITAYGLVSGTIYWFLTYEWAGAILLWVLAIVPAVIWLYAARRGVFRTTLPEDDPGGDPPPPPARRSASSPRRRRGRRSSCSG